MTDTLDEALNKAMSAALKEKMPEKTAAAIIDGVRSRAAVFKTGEKN